MANCTNLELTFEQGNILKGLGGAIYVLKASLHEGLNVASSATIQILAPNYLSATQLRQLLQDQNARLKLEQQPEINLGTSKPQVSHRYWCGQVRAAQFLGNTAIKEKADRETQDTTLYHYELRLSVPLAQMNDHHELRAFTNHSVLEVCADLLKPYLPQKEYTLNPDNEPSVLQQKQYIWVQNGESDAQLFQRLLFLHGLNFNLGHDG